MHRGRLPEVSGTLCSTLYPSDERHRTNPTASANFAEALPCPRGPEIADLVSPVLKVLIDLGYDWNGDPADRTGAGHDHERVHFGG
jgi:hypothetical protein